MMHLVCKSLQGVETASVGEGANRFLVVYPEGKTDLPVAPQFKREGLGGGKRTGTEGTRDQGNQESKSGEGSGRLFSLSDEALCHNPIYEETIARVDCARMRNHVSAQKRMVLIDQDGAGPGGSDQMAMLALLQAPDVQVLGITMVTGDAWRDEETLHTLRMLELTGHADVPVLRGAVFPLVRDQEKTRMEEALDGKVAWLGAWGGVVATTAGAQKPESHGSYEIPPMPEGLRPPSRSTKMLHTSSSARCALIRTKSQFTRPGR